MHRLGREIGMRRAVPGFVAVAVAATAIAVGMTTAASAADNWAVQPVSLPSGTSMADMAGVSCTSATNCEAVMNVDQSEPAAVRWNGTSWKAQDFPGGSGFAELATSVSCAAPSTCIAVGDGFANLWQGGTWLAMAYTNAPLDGVSCPSVRYCVAVGSQYVGDNDEPYAERWNGTLWKPMTVPAPSGTTFGGTLTSVSCTGITNCVAVGRTGNGTGSGTLAYAWNGTSWTQQTLPTPPAGAVGPELNGISCPSATDCTAVGDEAADGDGGNILFAEQWNGSTWTQQGPFALPVGTTYAQLSGVSCRSARCTAVGWSYPAAGKSYKNRHALTEYFNGTGWVVQRPALPDAHQFLSAVSCIAIHGCTAVGSSITKTPHVLDLPLAEQE